MTHQSSEGLEGSTGARALLAQGIPLHATLRSAIFLIAICIDAMPVKGLLLPEKSG
jgi:hypothetical protein